MSEHTTRVWMRISRSARDLVGHAVDIPEGTVGWHGLRAICGAKVSPHPNNATKWVMRCYACKRKANEQRPAEIDGAHIGRSED